MGDSFMLANESKMEPIDSNHTPLEGIKRASKLITCVNKTAKIGTPDKSGVSVKQPSEA